MAEYYKDERPGAVVDPGPGGSWGGLGGGDGGSEGGIPTGDGDWDGGWGGGDGGGVDGGMNGGWNGALKPSYRYLKTSESGYLCCAGGRILTGTLTCLRIPALIVQFETDGGDHDHSKCALFTLTDSRPVSLKKIETEREMLTRIFGYWNFKPGKFLLRARWQGGHYDYGAIWSMRIIVYGVDLGWRRIPLTHYADIASVEITTTGKVYVNHLAARVDGNAPYMEEE